MVGARQESGRPVVGSEFVDHQDESEERPIRRRRLDIHVKPLSWLVRPQRSSQQRTQLEWLPDDPAAGLEQGRKHVDVIERSTSIHEVTHPCCRAPDSDVVPSRPADGLDIGLG
jgi:hypothetical protein